ncbi:MAG: GatB/YqeY domain-containing protein [Anaerolineaceae bacterium]|jgi:hypothetical protein
MSLRNIIETDIQNSMRSRDEMKLRVLRLILSAIKLGDAEKGIPIEDATILTIIQKEVKIRLDSIKDYEAAGRLDLVEQNKQEIPILESYLPKQLSEEELIPLVKAAMQEVQASSAADMGKVMKVLLPRVQGRAPNALISQTVKRLLETKA